ncbi:hypothetical protein GCM10017056_39940 [Seohaeicola zhoushanensis]|uniref:Uncharacterized protein n=1 Tax=Seohaeicola zhoushanensis TaxID=1569283 RepID=A0A8J3H1T5_9RHOB|nr:hypothetical protein GCM10017056_39940 [Seohaeicola zhoushanensis]
MNITTSMEMKARIIAASTANQNGLREGRGTGSAAVSADIVILHRTGGRPATCAGRQEAHSICDRT